METDTQKHFNLATLTNEKQRQIFIRRLTGYINFIGQVVRILFIKYHWDIL
jgi:hypothetical protein